MDIKMLNKELGNADLILIDQILKDRFHVNMRILDAGCGEGRNMVYFVNNNFTIYGIDRDPTAVEVARTYLKSLNASFERENIQNFTIENIPFPDHFFDAILCINVLHSASGKDALLGWYESLIRMLAVGGFMLLSIKSRIGLSDEGDLTGSGNTSRNEEDYYLLTRDLLTELLQNDHIKCVEHAKSIITDGMSHTYLFLERKD